MNRVAVLGSGGGALAVAAELARADRKPVLADLPMFSSNLDPVREQGGVMMASDWHGSQLAAVEVADDLGSAVTGAGLVIVVVPCFGHEPFAAALAPILENGQALLFFGEGSGSIVARRALLGVGKEGVVVGESNTLPYLARPIGRGQITAFRKSGGVLVAGLPSAGTSALIELISDVWSYLTPAESVWDTVLINYNAIDHVATMVANASTLENRSGGMLLWGEGATPAVVRVIEKVDDELLDLRQALGLTDLRRYRDLLVAQGFAPDTNPTCTTRCAPAVWWLATPPLAMTAGSIPATSPRTYRSHWFLLHLSGRQSGSPHLLSMGSSPSLRRCWARTSEPKAGL